MAFLPPTPDVVNAGNSSTTPLVALTVTGANYSGTSLVLTGGWATGGSSAYVGQYFYVAGFTGAGVGNNSTFNGFICTASSAGSITLTVVGGYNGFTGAPIASQMFIGTAVDVTASPISAVTMFSISDQSSINFGALRHVLYPQSLAERVLTASAGEQNLDNVALACVQATHQRGSQSVELRLFIGGQPIRMERQTPNV